MWDVLSGVAEVAWDVLSGAAKIGMGCFVRGDKNCMGCFVRGGKLMRDVLSGVAKNGMGCFVPGCFVLHSFKIRVGGFLGTCNNDYYYQSKHQIPQKWNNVTNC